MEDANGQVQSGTVIKFLAALGALDAPQLIVKWMDQRMVEAASNFGVSPVGFQGCSPPDCSAPALRYASNSGRSVCRLQLFTHQVVAMKSFTQLSNIELSINHA